MYIRKAVIATLALGLTILGGSASKADIVSGVFNTGVDGTRMLLPDTSVDTHYTAATASGTTYVYSNVNYVQSPTAKYISYVPNGNGNVAAGVTTYSTNFSLTGYNPTTASLAGMVAADDGVVVSLNGNVIFQGGSYFAFSSFSTSQSFVDGLNTLSFAVYNGSGPTGFAVSNLSVSANVLGTPGPVAGAGLPVLLAMGGLWLARRSRSVRLA